MVLDELGGVDVELDLREAGVSAGVDGSRDPVQAASADALTEADLVVESLAQVRFVREGERVDPEHTPLR